MARDVTRMLLRLRANPRFRALSRGAQQLLVDLVLESTLTAAGVLPLMVDKWAAGCNQSTVASIRAELQELILAGFLAVDADRFEVLIRGYIRDSGVAAHPNHFKAAMSAAESVQSPRLRSRLAVELHELDRAVETHAVIELLAPPLDPDPSLMGSGSDVDAIGMASGSDGQA